MTYALHVTVSILICATVLIWSAARIAARRFDVREDLPLGLCNLSALLAPAQLLAPAPLLTAWAICVGGPSGIVSVLTPDLEARHDRATHLKFWIVHYGLILDALLCALLFAPSGGLMLLLRLAGAVAVLVAVAALVDYRLGANYLFLRAKPSTPSLLDKFGPWPLYLPPLVATAAFMIAASFAAWSAGAS